MFVVQTGRSSFFDLVFAAAISQLSAPLAADFSFHGFARYVQTALLLIDQQTRSVTADR